MEISRARFLLGFLVASTLVPATGWAAKPALKPLLFPASKNNLQVLPQRFEYTLIDEDRLKVGDILIDSTQVTFQVEPSPVNKGKYVIRFTWPAGLLKQGSLAIKNNSGKAIFNADIDRQNIKVTKGTPLEGEEDLRSEIASFTSEEVDSGIVDDMKYLPFMSFCVFKVEDATSLYLCSKELYFSSQGGQMTIKPRSTTKKVAQVNVNGKIVGNQGIIYLDDKTETVAFRAQTQSGSFIEIETRRKDVDFKDVITDAEGKRILLTASGAEPVDQSKVKKISDTEWKIELPASRPILYLNGEGDIPMRQEFYIKGPLPKEQERPFLSNKSVSRIYGSQVRVQGIAPDKIAISSSEPTATLQKLPKNQFSWTIDDIPRGEVTRRYLNVQTAENKFVVGYDIFRGNSYELSLGARYLTPSSIAYGDVNFLWWFEDFLGINSDAMRFHWGLLLGMGQHLTTKDGEPKADFTNIALLWRAEEGFYLEDATWGLRLPIQMINVEGSSTMAQGVGAFWQRQSPSWLKYSQWVHLSLDYFLSSSGGDIKLKSGYAVKALLDRKFSSKMSLRYGLGLQSYEFDVAGAKSEMQITPEIGFAYRF